MSSISSKKDRIDLRLRAQEYADLALKTLVNVMRTGETDRDRVAAAKEVLDRAYGKAVQAHRMEENPEDEGNEEMASNAERFTSTIAGIAARNTKK